MVFCYQIFFISQQLRYLLASIYCLIPFRYDRFENKWNMEKFLKGKRRRSRKKTEEKDVSDFVVVYSKRNVSEMKSGHLDFYTAINDSNSHDITL